MLPSETAPSTALEVYATHDNGNTWLARPALPLGTRGSVVTSSFVGGRYAWVVDGMILATTRDGGQSWTAISPQGLPLNSELGIVDQLDFVNSRTGWALVRQPKDSPNWYLLTTHNSGQNWRSLAPTLATADPPPVP